MNTTNNTILITGGSAGIGFEIARQLSEKNNHVIILGRSEYRLQKAAAQLKNVTALTGDVSDPDDVERLVKTLYRDFPSLNILINNAGKAFVYDLAAEGADGFTRAAEEMLTNYLSVIRLTEKLLPLLRRQPEAAVVNVSSIVSIVPNHRLATYGASKAALHSWSLSLRHALKDTAVKVFELQPPLVDTEFSTEIGGHRGIKPSVVAEELIHSLATDNFEIRVGNTEHIYQLYLTSPEQAFQALNPTAVTA